MRMPSGRSMHPGARYSLSKRLLQTSQTKKHESEHEIIIDYSQGIPVCCETALPLTYILSGVSPFMAVSGEVHEVTKSMPNDLRQ